MVFSSPRHAAGVLLYASLTACVCAAGMRAAYAKEPPLIFGGHVIAVLKSVGPSSEGTLAISPDRHHVYVVSGQRPSRRQQPPLEAKRAHDAELQEYDVTDPQHPVAGDTVRIGDIFVDALIVRPERLFIWATDPDRAHARLMVFNLNDPDKPALMRTTLILAAWTRIRISDDGACIALIGIQFFRVAPDGTLGVGACDPGSDVERFFSSNAHAGVGLDRLQDRQLVSSGDNMEVWTTPAGVAPRRLGEINVAPNLDLAKGVLLDTPDNLVAGIRVASDPEVGWQAAVIDYQKPSFSWRFLARAYKVLLTNYETQRSASKALLDASVFDGLAHNLPTAGASDLLPDHDEPSRRSEEVAILNTWGFWLSQGSHPAEAVPVLTQALRLQPNHIDAWRNLADAARMSVPASVATEKERLTRIALDAGDRYRALTGHHEPAMAAFAALNVLNAPRTNVCSYVAAFYTAGRQADIGSISDLVDVDGSGRKIHLEVEYAGSLRIPSVAASREEGGDASQSPVFGGQGDGSPGYPSGSIILLDFDGHYYAVTDDLGAPKQVLDRNGVVQCEFHAVDVASISETHDSVLCNDLLNGALPNNVIAAPLPKALDHAVIFQEGEIKKVADVDLSGNGQPDRVGYFTDWTRQGGCATSGVTLIDGDTVQQSPRNKALIETQVKLTNCRGTRAFLTSARGHVYAEVDSGIVRGANGLAPLRSLFRVTT